MNKVILMGRLTRDPKVTYSQGENSIPVARFSLAVDRRMKRDPNGEDTQTADFINCVAFQKNAEFIEKYFKQGMRVLISGRIQTGSYTNRETGQKVYTTDVVVEEQEFADSKNVTVNDNNNFGNVQPSTHLEPTEAKEGFMKISDGVEDDGLPFN